LSLGTYSSTATIQIPKANLIKLLSKHLIAKEPQNLVEVLAQASDINLAITTGRYGGVFLLPHQKNQSRFSSSRTKLFIEYVNT